MCAPVAIHSKPFLDSETDIFLPPDTNTNDTIIVLVEVGISNVTLSKTEDVVTLDRLIHGKIENIAQEVPIVSDLAAVDLIANVAVVILAAEIMLIDSILIRVCNIVIKCNKNQPYSYA